MKYENVNIKCERIFDFLRFYKTNKTNVLFCALSTYYIAFNSISNNFRLLQYPKFLRG